MYRKLVMWESHFYHINHPPHTQWNKGLLFVKLWCKNYPFLFQLHNANMTCGDFDLKHWIFDKLAAY